MLVSLSALSETGTKYVSSFHEEEPEQLVRLQNDHWKPLLDWARKDLGVDIKIHQSILGADQPAKTKDKLHAILSGLDEWQLAGSFSLHLDVMRRD